MKEFMIHMILITLVLIGGLNWLLVGAFRFDLVAFFLGKSIAARSIYVIIGLSALFLAIYRDTYLPFLGVTVAPCSAFSEKAPPGATTEVNVMVKPNAKVFYWAAEPDTEHMKALNNWKDAYLGYENAGVTTADSKGQAILKDRPPQAYLVPWKGRLEPHIHFRQCWANGILSPIQTVFLSDGHVEGFMI